MHGCIKENEKISLVTVLILPEDANQFLKAKGNRKRISAVSFVIRPGRQHLQNCKENNKVKHCTSA
jgi:hypothetical protein